MNKAGRPRDGKEVKIPCTVMIEPEKKELLIKDFKTLSKAIDTLINEYIKINYPDKED